MRNLTYPVNVLRNIARQNAPTYYVLASDAELYPSPNLVADFMQVLDPKCPHFVFALKLCKPKKTKRSSSLLTRVRSSRITNY